MQKSKDILFKCGIFINTTIMQREHSASSVSKLSKFFQYDECSLSMLGERPIYSISKTEQLIGQFHCDSEKQQTKLLCLIDH